MMNYRHPRLLKVLAHLLLGLCLLLGLSVLAGGTALVAHAASAATTTVSTCDESHLDAALASASSGDTITFSCSGDIALTQTLNITKNLTLDGSGQTVTLDGQHTVQVLVVNSGVSFALNALTVAHGSAAEFAGGIFNQGTLTVSNSTLSANSGVNGGGIFNQGTLTVSNSTLSNNYGLNGGGIDNQGTMTVSNSTLSNNSAGSGGGMYNFDTATISNSTLSNNSAQHIGGGFDSYKTVTFFGSIIANNSAGFDGGNCYGNMSDSGYNLSSDNSCYLPGTGSMQNTDPRLAPNGLQNNGGPTQTIALQQGSPAIDQIPAANCPSSDQRGNPRPDDGESTCDIGAYESNYQDKDLALSNVPANITTDAISPQGAAVTYTSPTVVDEDSPLPPVTCMPSSGSTFAIGTTTVTCTVTDSDDSNSPVRASFTVTVKGAATQVNDLTNLVNSFQLSSGLQNALDAKLNATLKAITAGQTTTACSDLSDFIGQVQAQTGKGITANQASQLIAAAKQVQAVLGC